MRRLHKKRSASGLHASYCNAEVTENEGTEDKVPQDVKLENNSDVNLEKGATDEDNKIGDECEGEDVCENDVSLCTISMIGVVLQSRPKLDSIKSICLQSHRDCNLTLAVHICTECSGFSLQCTCSEPLIIMWLNQLRKSRFLNSITHLKYSKVTAPIPVYKI